MNYKWIYIVYFETCTHFWVNFYIWASIRRTCRDTCSVKEFIFSIWYIYLTSNFEMFLWPLFQIVNIIFSVFKRSFCFKAYLDKSEGNYVSKKYYKLNKIFRFSCLSYILWILLQIALKHQKSVRISISESFYFNYL